MPWAFQGRGIKFLGLQGQDKESSMELHIGLKKEFLKKSVQQLKQVLANEMVLYVKTRNYHWNIKGQRFGPMHKLFESQYEKEAEWIDEIAERIRMLGQVSPGSMEEFLKLATLKESVNESFSEKEMLQSLLADQESIIVELRNGVDFTQDECHDIGTSDFLTGLLRDHEQMAWITRSHLQG